MSMNQVAVIIVNYNSEDLLCNCLNALAQQTYKPHRIIVIDNGSSPPLSNRIHQYPVEIEYAEENLGFAAACNLGIKLADDCEWVALLNPDAFPKSDWLMQLIMAAKENPHFTCFASHLICAESPEIIDGTGDVYHVSGRPWRRDHGRKALSTRQSEEIFAPCAAAALYQRAAMLEVGGFDEHYFCYVEDVDLGFRLQLANYRCLYVSSACVFHIGSAITGKKSDFYVYHGQRNLIWTYVKNMPSILFWIYLPQHIILNIFALLLFKARGQYKVAFQAKKDAIFKLRIVLKQRKQIQKNRKTSLRRIHRLMAKGLPFRK